MRAGGTRSQGLTRALREAWDARPAGEAGSVSTALRDGVLPHVVAWNLTARCNLSCPHCYISAGAWRPTGAELSTDEVRRVTGEILDLNPAPMFVLSGGEPLLRPDLEEIARHASEEGATVVVGTNGTLLTEERVVSLREAGVRGVALSVDSLRPAYHDRFRGGRDALRATVEAVERLGRHRLDFVVQTTLTRANREEVETLARWSADRGAVCFNLYFLVPTGRGERMGGEGRLTGLTPEENERVLERLTVLQRELRGRMMVRAKCQPQFMRHVHRDDPDSPLLRYRTRCPCGVHYCRITPEGKVTPCPYLPEVAGDLRRHDFRRIWERSPLFERLRGEAPGGKCGRCEYREVCGGCRARAHAATGDLMAADASCAYDPPGDRPVVRPPDGATYGDRTHRSLPWTPEAEARLERIPSFVRGVVAARLEGYARSREELAVTVELMRRVRREMPVDFSRRLPFFAREEEE